MNGSQVEFSQKKTLNSVTENWVFSPRFFLPQAQSQDVRQQQRRDEDFEELGGEDAAFLHGASLPHAEGHGAPGVTEVKLPEGERPESRFRKPDCGAAGAERPLEMFGKADALQAPDGK